MYIPKGYGTVFPYMIVDDANAFLTSHVIVACPHLVDELGLAGDVDVIGALLDARFDDRFAVTDVRANRCQHDTRGRSQAVEA